ncbi:hypothetical protein LTR85_006165 [Meristemomyces frigidus]|nr:hypothetical protein LTR85_006165 [Meristemomyces frigidus]
MTTSSADPAPAAPHLTLLGLPAEIRNQIFGYAVTSSTPILMRMESKRTSTDWQERVQPGLPVLSEVCRELRSTVPSLYYSLNTFYFTDHFSNCAALMNFYRLRGQDIRFIERVMVRHSGLVASRKNFQSFEYDMSFLATLEASGAVSISRCVARRKRQRDGLCTCVLEQLAAAASTARELAVQNGALFLLLMSYEDSLKNDKPDESLDYCEECWRLRAN